MPKFLQVRTVSCIRVHTCTASVVVICQYNSTKIHKFFSIQLVESIPEGLTYPDCSPKFMSTFDAWNRLFDLATDSINIGSFYWTLRGADFYNHSSAWQGEKIFERFLATGTQRKVNIRIAQSAPSKSSPNIDTEIFVKEKAAKVRSVDFERLLGGGVLHTKLWIVDQQHM